MGGAVMTDDVVVEVLTGYYCAHGVTMTLDECCEAFRWSSKSVAKAKLESLADAKRVREFRRGNKTYYIPTGAKVVRVGGGK